MPPQKRKINPLMFIPGTLFWVLIAIGIATGHPVFLGVGIGVAGFTMIALTTVRLREASATRAERKRIWNDGISATARVVTIGTNGSGMNDHPMIDFDLDLVGEHAPGSRVHTSAIISKLAIPRIQPGCEIHVRLDPRDRSRLVIDQALTPYGY